MPSPYVDLSHLPRWRVEGRVLLAADDPRRHGSFTAEVSADDAMTAMRLAAFEVERRDLTTRGRPFMFTSVTRE